MAARAFFLVKGRPEKIFLAEYSVLPRMGEIVEQFDGRVRGKFRHYEIDEAIWLHPDSPMFAYCNRQYTKTFKSKKSKDVFGMVGDIHHFVLFYVKEVRIHRDGVYDRERKAP